MLCEANSSGLVSIACTGSLAQAMSLATAFMRSLLPSRTARITAIDGEGPMAAAVAQHAVVVSGEISQKSTTPWSMGTKLICRLVSLIISASPLGREDFAATTVGAAFATPDQNSIGKVK